VLLQLQLPALLQALGSQVLQQPLGWAAGHCRLCVQQQLLLWLLPGRTPGSPFLGSRWSLTPRR
jgi:hypothetical protein